MSNLTFKANLVPGSTSQEYALGSPTQIWKIYGLLSGTAEYATTAGNGGVTGVKGNSETDYRTGQVNITAANIGLGNVENIALSTWQGSTAINTIGTLTTGNIPWSLLTEIPIASTTTIGIVSLSSATNSNSQNIAATPAAVKAAYDLAAANDGTVTSITIKTSSPLTGGSNTALTTSGSYTIGFSNQNANTVLAGPSSGDAAAPSFRTLVAADIPNLNASKITDGILAVSRGGTGKGNLKDAANDLINALDTGNVNLTANDYVITQYVGGGTTTTTYHRRPASALRVGGLLNARKLQVNLASTTNATFDGTSDQLNIPISGVLGIEHGGTGTTNTAAIQTTLGVDKAIKSITRSGTTFTYTCVDGTTGTFTQQDSNTKNTAGASNSTSKIYVIGAVSQGTNPVTYSNTKVFATDGELTATTFVGALNGTAAQVSGLLTIGDKTYNGATDTTIELADLNLTKAVDFLGVTTTPISTTANTTTNPITLVSGSSVTATNGNVVLVKDSGEEFIWAENRWEPLGLATNYALANHIHGNINSRGTITTTATIANGNRLVITNSSNEVTSSSITFGTSTTTFLTNKGTWATPGGTYSLPTASSTTKGGIMIGTGLSMDSDTLNVSLSSATNSSATNVAATPAAVKAAYDLAASKTNNTGTVTSITLKAGGGISLDTDNSAITTSGTRTISHSDTSSVTNLTADGRKYVTGLTFDTYGHVTAYTTGTETVTNTDTKVTQSSTTTDSWRKILLHNKYESSPTEAVQSATDVVYSAVGVAVQPSSGTIRATIYDVADHVKLQYNETTNALDFVFV